MAKIKCSVYSWVLTLDSVEDLNFWCTGNKNVRQQMRGSSYDKVDFCSLSSPSEQTYEKFNDKCMYMYFHWKLLDYRKTYWNKRKKYEYQNDFSVSLISLSKNVQLPNKSILSYSPSRQKTQIFKHGQHALKGNNPEYKFIFLKHLWIISNLIQ